MLQAKYRSTIIGNKELKNKPSDGIVLVESQKNIPMLQSHRIGFREV